jgi:succinate dehydrogenase / fumarate reductase, membrane anchor subunit
MSDKNHSFVKDWIALRATALAAIPLTVWFVYSIVKISGTDYATFITWLAQPWNALLLAVFIIVGFYHGALGTHEIIEDYMPEEQPRKTIICALNFTLLALGAVCLLSIAKVAVLS